MSGRIPPNMYAVLSDDMTIDEAVEALENIHYQSGMVVIAKPRKRVLGLPWGDGEVTVFEKDYFLDFLIRQKDEDEDEGEDENLKVALKVMRETLVDKAGSKIKARTFFGDNSRLNSLRFKSMMEKRNSLVVRIDKTGRVDGLFGSSDTVELIEGLSIPMATSAGPPPVMDSVSNPPKTEVVLSGSVPGVMVEKQKYTMILEVALRGDEDEFDVTATADAEIGKPITANLFDMKDCLRINPPFLQLEFPASGKPTRKTVELQARSIGVGSLAVIFYQGTEEIGRLLFDYGVQEHALPSFQTPSELSVSAQRESGAKGTTLVSVFPPDDLHKHYRFTVSSDALELIGQDYASKPLMIEGDESEAAFKSLVRKTLFSLEPVKGIPEAVDTARAAGRKVASHAFPAELYEVLNSSEDLGVINLTSKEHLIPWEIVLPNKGGNKSRHLCEFGQVRNLPGRAPSKSFKIENAIIVNGNFKRGNKSLTPLKWNPEWLPGVTPQVLNTPTSKSIIQLLKEEVFDFLHINCHGHSSQEDPSNSRIIVSDGEVLSISEISNALKDNSYVLERKPFVFLNACRSGQAGVYISKWEGWPESFWEIGAGGFIGTAWSVRNDSANTFAETFYDEFLRGERFAQSVLKARQNTRDKHEDTTWLAYQAYGKPHAYVDQTD